MDVQLPVRRIWLSQKDASRCLLLVMMHHNFVGGPAAGNPKDTAGQYIAGKVHIEIEPREGDSHCQDERCGAGAVMTKPQSSGGGKGGIGVPRWEREILFRRNEQRHVGKITIRPHAGDERLQCDIADKQAENKRQRHGNPGLAVFGQA